MGLDSQIRKKKKNNPSGENLGLFNSQAQREFHHKIPLCGEFIGKKIFLRYFPENIESLFKKKKKS